MGKGIASGYIPPTKIMICKDCYHKDVCGDKDYLTENSCFNHKNIDLVAVLPCKAGDTVYFIQTAEVQVFKINTIKLWENNAISLHGYYNSLSRKRGTPHEITIGNNTIGKTVFLSHEEAEKALEGKKNDSTRFL